MPYARGVGHKWIGPFGTKNHGFYGNKQLDKLEIQYLYS